MLIKICGITESSELKMLDRAGVDYAGLWFRIPHGKFCLDHSKFAALVNTPLERIRCVGVTTENNPDVIVRYVKNLNVSGIQLHGFQLPRQVESIRRHLSDDIELFKVLHVQGGKCLESPMLEKYSNCGADAFILDNFISSEQPGSTGECIPTETLEALISSFGSRRLFLAGGIDSENIKALKTSYSLLGVDIDTGARHASKIDKERVLAIVSANREPN